MKVIVILCGLVAVSLGQVFPQRKTWWAKAIIPRQLYTAGELTETQLKQAADDGYKSVIRLETRDPQMKTMIGTELILNFTAEESLAFEIGMKFSLIEHGDLVEGVRQLGQLLLTMPKPVVYHCRYSNESTFASLLHWYNTTTGAYPEEVFTKGDRLGYQFRRPAFIDAVSEIANASLSIAEEPISDDPWYETMWWLRPVSEGVFLSGQIKSNYLPLLVGKIQTYLNLRRAAVTGGNPTQEEVTLLNIRDRTGTYIGSGRQSESQLLKWRINSNRPNTYVSKDSTVNYQQRNELEYGDDVGYNESIARDHIMEKYSFEYVRTPVGAPYGYEIKLWEAYSDVWLNVEKPVVFQCRTGYRSAVATVMTLAYQQDQNSTWALQMARDIGYPFSGNIAILFRQVLDNRPVVTTEQSPMMTTMESNVNGSSCNVLSILALVMSISLLVF